MYDIRIFKAAHHMHDCIDFTDISKELVAESLSFGRALDESCNIHKLNRCRNDLLRVVHLAQHIQSFVRHCHDADIRVDRTERIICRFRARLGQ